jgi:nickel transport protein
MLPKGFFIVMLIGSLLLPLPVLAHKVTVFAWIEGDTIHTESKFSGGKKVKGGKIEIFDQLDRKILEGTTDDQGNFAFSRPQNATAIKIVLTAGMGHTNFWRIAAEELGGARAVQAQPSPNPQPETTDEVHLNANAIEQIVERAVEKKLAPLKAQLAQQAWGLRDIVAGIGYILGLMGLASYIRYRKTTKA